jgi:hypothetical protein
MTIQVASRIVSDERRNGRAGWVHVEIVFTDDTDPTFRLVACPSFEALAGEDAAVRLAAKVAQETADLATFEIARNVREISAKGSLATPRLRASTLAQNAAAVRAAYQTASDIDAVMIGDYLSTLSDARLQTAFSLTAGQVTTLRTNKLTPAATAAANLRASTGQ